MYHIFAKTPLVKNSVPPQFKNGGEAKGEPYPKGSYVTYKGKSARVVEWMRLKLAGVIAIQYKLQMSNGRFTGWIGASKIKPAKKMADGGDTKSSGKAKAMLSKVFRTPEKCSDAGATLATDSLPRERKAPAGKRLGSLKCKVPARTRRTALSGSGKGYEKSPKKK